MYDRHNEIIYIGKAVNLKRRVLSYFINLSKREPHKKIMVRNITDFNTISVDTELDALLLECQLIQRYHPIYNIRLNHYERYLYLTVDHKLHFTNSTTTKPIFGPYQNQRLVRKVQPILDNLYFKDLKSCHYQIRVFDPKNVHIDYDIALKELIDFFRGRTDAVEQRMIDNRDFAAKIEKFEPAQHWNEELQILREFSNQNQRFERFLQQDKIAVIPLSNQTNKLYYIKHGKLLKTQVIRNTSKIKKKSFNFSNPQQIMKRSQLDQSKIIESYLYTKAIKTVEL